MDYLSQEKRLQIFIKSGWVCEVCNGYLNRYNSAQLGHRINQNKVNLKKYGKEVIHHPLNLAPTCCLECNGKVSLYGKDRQIRELVQKIQSDIDKNT